MMRPIKMIIQINTKNIRDRLRQIKNTITNKSRWVQGLVIKIQITITLMTTTMDNQMVSQQGILITRNSIIKTIRIALRLLAILTKRLTINITNRVLLRPLISRAVSYSKQTNRLQTNNLIRPNMKSICRAKVSRRTKILTPKAMMKWHIYKDYELLITMIVT